MNYEEMIDKADVQTYAGIREALKQELQQKTQESVMQAPESIQSAIKSSTEDICSQMDAFGHSEMAYIPEPGVWKNFIKTQKERIEQACSRVKKFFGSDVPQDTAVANGNSTEAIQASETLVSTLQDGSTYFDKANKELVDDHKETRSSISSIKMAADELMDFLDKEGVSDDAKAKVQQLNQDSIALMEHYQELYAQIKNPVATVLVVEAARNYHTMRDSIHNIRRALDASIQMKRDAIKAKAVGTYNGIIYSAASVFSNIAKKIARKMIDPSEQYTISVPVRPSPAHTVEKQGQGSTSKETIEKAAAANDRPPINPAPRSTYLETLDKAMSFIAEKCYPQAIKELEAPVKDLKENIQRYFQSEQDTQYQNINSQDFKDKFQAAVNALRNVAKNCIDAPTVSSQVALNAAISAVHAANQPLVRGYTQNIGRAMETPPTMEKANNLDSLEANIPPEIPYTDDMIPPPEVPPYTEDDRIPPEEPYPDPTMPSEMDAPPPIDEVRPSPSYEPAPRTEPSDVPSVGLNDLLDEKKQEIVVQKIFEYAKNQGIPANKVGESLLKMKAYADLIAIKTNTVAQSAVR